MEFLRSNTAVLVAVGPFYDKTDGVTIETALTITNERITLIAETDAGSAPTLILDNITGATAATANDLNYITAGDSGMMQLELAAADVNRVGRMKLQITDAANHVPVFHSYFVLPQAIFDWLTGVIVPLPANVTTWLGTAAATPTVAGVPEVDPTHWNGTAVSTPATAGIPEVNVKNFNNLAAVALPLVPTTAGRTLDVSVGGEAGLDWANVGSPTTALNLSATNIDVDQIVASVSGAVGSVTGAVGSVTGAVGSVTGAVGSVTGLTASNLDATITSRATPAQVNTEVLDVLNVDTFAEPGQGAPAATTTLVGKLGYLYKFLRNRKTQTSTTLSVFADDATTVDQKATISDNGTTYDHGEVATGP